MGCCEGELEGVVLVLVGGLLGPGMLVGDSLELVCCIADFHFLSWVSGISFVWLPVSTIILVVKSSRLWIGSAGKFFFLNCFQSVRRNVPIC